MTNQKDGTSDKIATIFQFLDSMEKGLDQAKWRLEKRIKEIQREQKEAKEEYLLKKAEIVARLNEVWDEVDPMED